MPYLIESMKGLGDSIYIRAFVKQIQDEVYLVTPWPELFEDLPNVKFVNPNTQLRTQAKNVASTSHKFVVPRVPTKKIKVQYTGQDFRSGSMIKGMQRCFGFPPGEFDLPMFESPVKAGKPIAVIRPATVRREWSNPARNPKPEYLAWVADQLKETHHVVSVADLQDGEEWILGPEPFAHEKFHQGELDVRGLLGLVAHADLCVGGVGWLLPACVAYFRPLFCILGGQGGHNGPDKVASSDMDLSKIWFAKPDNFCQCTNMQHSCNKEISTLERQWTAFLKD